MALVAEVPMPSPARWMVVLLLVAALVLLIALSRNDPGVADRAPDPQYAAAAEVS